jgi:hypothetical protein
LKQKHQRSNGSLEKMLQKLKLNFPTNASRSQKEVGRTNLKQTLQKQIFHKN